MRLAPAYKWGFFFCYTLAMKVSLVVIADAEYGIGKSGQTPWSFPAYQKYFENLVCGHPVVMGRKIYESRGPVPGNINMVVTGDTEYETGEDRVLTDTDIHMAIERCKWLDRSEDVEVFVVGGAETFLFCLTNGLIDRIYLTHISRKSYDCDTFFHDYVLPEWFNESYRTVRYPDRENPERLEFIVYNRRRADQPKDKKKTQ